MRTCPPLFSIYSHSHDFTQLKCHLEPNDFHFLSQFCLLKSRLIYLTAYFIPLIGRHLKLSMLETSSSLPTHYSHVSSTVFTSHSIETTSSQLLSLKTLVLLDPSCSYHTSNLLRNVLKICPIISLYLLLISLVMIYNVSSFGLLQSSPNISFLLDPR